jgi:hypothetical protein
VKGIRKRWRARIYYDGKQHHLGTFDTKEEAALAYDNAALLLPPPNTPPKTPPETLKSIRGGTLTDAEAATVIQKCRACRNKTYKKGHLAGCDRFACKWKTKPFGTKQATSGFHGVLASKKRWRARIYYDGKHHHLGNFDTKEEAALAYDNAALHLQAHGGRPRPLNMPQRPPPCLLPHPPQHRPPSKSAPSDSGWKGAAVGENRTRFRSLWLSRGHAMCLIPTAAPTPVSTSLPTAAPTAAPTARRKAHPATRVARPRR